MRIIVPLLCLFLSACSSESASVPPPVAAVTIPASIFASSRPVDVSDLLAVKEHASPGDRVTFLARVGGRSHPFVDNLAIFVVADPSLVSCELMGEEDHCPLPWDYCCEDRGAITKGLATVQIVAEGGVPFGVTAEGSGGLEGSKFVVIDGTVLEKNDEGLFTINADSIWVGGKPNRADHSAGNGAPSKKVDH